MGWIRAGSNGIFSTYDGALSMSVFVYPSAATGPISRMLDIPVILNPIVSKIFHTGIH